MKLGSVQAALEDFDACLGLEADFVPALACRAFVLSRLQRNHKALRVEHARRAVEPGENGAWMDTLAAALAESGDFK